MTHYITVFAKFFITIFMCLYTLECFLVFRFKEEKQRRGTYIRQIVLIILMHFSCFLSICLKSGNIDFLFFYAIFQIIILAIMEVIPMIFPRINRLLINNACMLMSIGLVMLTRLDFQNACKQLIIILVSFIIGIMIPIAMHKLKGIPNYPYIYAAIGIIMLAGVYVLGATLNGSKLSVSIFGLSFQASEFVKILFVFFVAGMLYKSTSILNLIITSLLAAMHVFMLAASKDLGAALIMFVTYVLMVFIATRNYLYLFVGTGVGVFASMIAYKVFRHIQVRVLAFIDPFSVIDREGYQITQSLFAISSGNWFGLGLFEGTPETIPYVETDFIFSAICQEFGIIFAICMILICLSCFIMFVNIALRFKDKYKKYIAYGLGSTYIFQVFLTIGGGVKFIPLTGVTLPLISYGGSSIMATVFTIFIIEGLYLLRTDKEVALMDKETELDKKLAKRQNNMMTGTVYFVIAVFVALCAYMCWYVATNEQELLNNSYNPRQEVLITQNTRGTIYSRNNDILAQTRTNSEGQEYRYYPYANIFSHVVGYASNGRAGVEGQANYYLINSNAPISSKIEADIREEKYIGDSVITTLDTDLQKVAYTAIGNYRGAVVVTNPKTGEILAMVSKPDFDPNSIDAIWDDLINDKDSSVLLNRATQGLYPPGSTFKIVTLLEFIREHPDDYNDYSYTCTGTLSVDDSYVACYNHDIHGKVNITKSLAKSCNCSFGNIGLLLDRTLYQATLDSLLFNTTLPLTMNYSQSNCNVDTITSDLEMVQTAFGQGQTLITPMHLNMITAAIANDGVLMKPYIVSSVVNSNFVNVKTFGSESYKQLMTKEEADIITGMMEEVCKTGTAKRFKKSSYSVAGKTGSAEYSDVDPLTHSWFTGFAPVDDPQICVTIILESAGTSGTIAVPMAQKIFNEYFQRFDTELESDY